MNNERFRLESALTIGECINRLSAAINHPSDGYDHLWIGSGNARIRGRIRVRTFRVNLLVPGNNGSAYTWALGTMSPKSDGTVIKVSCPFNESLYSVKRAALALTIVVGPLVIFTSLANANYRWNELLNFREHADIVVLLPILAFNGIYPLAKKGYLSKRAFLLDFLSRTLQAYKPR